MTRKDLSQMRSLRGGGALVAILTFFLTLLLGAILIPNLATTADYNPARSCRIHRGVFTRALERATADSLKNRAVEVHANNFLEMVQKLEKMYGEVAYFAYCPITLTPYLTGSDPNRIERVIVCCQFHANVGEEFSGILLPVFPTVSPELISSRENEYRERFLRGKYPLGSPSRQWVIVICCAIVLGFLTHRLTNP